MWTTFKFALYIRQLLKDKTPQDAHEAVELIGVVLEDGVIDQSEWLKLGHKLGILRVPQRRAD